MPQYRYQRLIRPISLAAMYAGVAALSLWFSYQIRFDGRLPVQYREQFEHSVAWVMIIQTIALAIWGQVRVIPTFFSMVDLRSVVVANSVSGLLLMFATMISGRRIPVGVMVLDLILVTVGVAVARLILRHWGDVRRARRHGDVAAAGVSVPIGIVGAGDAGAALARELFAKPQLRLKPVAFFDDNPLKWHQRLHGIPVVGGPERLKEAVWQRQIRKVVIAMPSARASRVGEVARIATGVGIPSETVPALDQLVDGRVRVTELRPVQIEDLLRREPVAVDQDGIHRILRGRVIMVTGAGGSIGSELCRQILAHGARQLLLVERSEVQLFQIEQELLNRDPLNRIVPLVADIADSERMKSILSRFRPHVVFHAAAHKHVPLMENQPGEAIRNNALGTAALATVSDDTGVELFVLISTDKAINPTSVMGATKRVAEVFLQAFQAESARSTRFVAVRFGNVLGSSGSVVPTFQRQIAGGGPVTVTDARVTRFFMTIPEAVGLVLQAGALGKGGEIFVLDMGEPVKIVDLARQMIELSGYRPEVDIKIEFTGLRPGEKLYEELSHQREELKETGHPKILRFTGPSLPLNSVQAFFEKVRPVLESAEPDFLKASIMALVPEYKPYRPPMPAKAPSETDSEGGRMSAMAKHG